MKTKENTYQTFMLSIFLLYFVYWFYQGHFLFQLNHRVLKTTGIDNTYWLFCILRIPQTIILFGIYFDVLLVLGFITGFITHNKWWFRFLFLIVIIHVVTFNIFSGIHSKSCVILPLVLLPYCFPAIKNLLSDGVRLYLLFIFISAAIYKIANGGLLHENQLVHILENQHLDLSILQPDHFIYKISLWIINHTFIAGILWYLFFATELIFVAGLFTKKYDSCLAVLLVIMIVCTYAVMRISLFDFILFLPFLVNNPEKQPELDL